MILLAGLVFTGIDDVIQTPVHRVRVFLLIVAWGLAGYLLVAAGGLQLSALPGGGRLWPTDWNVAYQAPLLAFVFALIPTVPAAARSLTGARSPTGTPREP